MQVDSLNLGLGTPKPVLLAYTTRVLDHQGAVERSGKKMDPGDRLPGFKY